MHYTRVGKLVRSTRVCKGHVLHGGVPRRCANPPVRSPHATQFTQIRKQRQRECQLFECSRPRWLSQSPLVLTKLMLCHTVCGHTGIQGCMMGIGEFARAEVVIASMTPN